MQFRARRFDTRETVDIVLDGGKLARIQTVASPASADLPWVAPGLIDVQMNGYGGQEFSSSQLTTRHVESIGEAMTRFGVTGYCPTVTTESIEVLRHAVGTIAAACRQSPRVAGQVVGIHVEGPYISREDGARGAHPLAHCRPPDWDEFLRLQDAAEGRVRIVTLSPEYDAAPAFIEKATASGVVVAIGHTAATPEQVRRAVESGARLSTHLGNGSHTILPRHPNYIWTQLADDRLAASIIADGHHLPAEVVRSFVRAKAIERTILVSDLSGLAGLPPGRYASNLCELEILDDGRLVVAGQRKILAGASRPLCDCVANVLPMAGVSLASAITMATVNPLRLLGLTCPSLRPGDNADLILFALDERSSCPRFDVLAVYAAGELVHGELPQASVAR